MSYNKNTILEGIKAMQKVKTVVTRKILLLISIMFITTAMLAYEVLITRLFSAVLLHHFVFMVISFSILGLGLGGIWAYRISKKFGDRINEILVKLTLILPVVIGSSVLVIYKIPHVGIGILYAFVSSIPFVVAGSILSLLFKKYSRISSRLYFADLLGSAAGSVLIIFLMNKLGFMLSLICILIISALTSIMMTMVYKFAKIRIVALLLLIIFIVVPFNMGFIKNLEKNFNSYYASPYTLINHLTDTEETVIEIPYVKWDAISRTEVIQIDNKKKEKYILTDGGGTTSMIRFDGDLKKVEYLKDRIDFIPFAFGKNDQTLIIGAGGGKDVLLALLGGSKEIDAVEINSSTLEAVAKFSDFNGNIYGLKEVKIYNQDGRYFIKNSQKKYDHIYLSMVMTNAIENTAFSLSENYIFTYEAFNEYFHHLKKDGKLSFMAHSSMDMLRILFTGIKVLQDIGIPQEEITDHLMIINRNKTTQKQSQHEDYINMPIITFKLTPFTQKEIQLVASIAKKQNRGIIHLPNYIELELLQEYKKGNLGFEEIIKNLRVNITPTTDDRPFFYNFDKGLPRIMVRLLLIVFALVIYIKRKYYQDTKVKQNSLYFACIAIAFMMIEIPLIQKMILFVGSPSIAFSFILFIILLSAGMGSLVSKNKIFYKKHNSKYLPLLLTGIGAIVMPYIIKLIYTNFFAFGQIQRMLIISLALSPLGFFMGMAFPYGMHIIESRGYKHHIPLVWGMNGMMSVVGSILAVTFSMAFGFNLTLTLGGLIYIVLYIKNPLFKKA